MPGDAPSYAASGVDLDATEATTALLGPLARATHGPEVPRGLGLFGGLYDASALKGMERPLLVSSLDGIGTKTRLATRYGSRALAGLGRDIVNHCVNDVAVQGARPLFFLDYLAFCRLDPAHAAHLVGGMAEACREASCALVGGETAEMPAIYRDGEYDVAGCLVGVVEAGDLIDGRAIVAGDCLLGLPSRGLHTNGYSLALRLLPTVEDGLSERERERLADDLLASHPSYLGAIAALRAAVPVHGLAHVTGGGIPGNLVRILPPGLVARVDTAAWTVPPLFRRLQRAGAVADEEMYRVFNMGIGLIAVVPAASASAALDVVPGAVRIGHVTPTDGRDTPPRVVLERASHGAEGGVADGAEKGAREG
ncbi:MAG: phosphoribosylformylglycinamidine cyclo-ligase [Chloroflexota bacterium]